MMTMYLGSPDQISEVPAWIEEALIGAPQVIANAKQALMIPEKVATRMRLVKLNSAIAFFLSSSGISLSLVKPAKAAIPIPSRQTATPARVTWPGVVPAICPMVWITAPLGKNEGNIGGTNVPNAAQ